ncbi:YdcF family protein [Paraferrimonas haliotis]|uniref:DUF218 domain-containing protein n=1 Tax=Paraferrimonas haliotis TaxID=2013866 RepID=A0AA37TNA2_9GAMM|nr:ElyC/SanA/YdcF family protein [Paraferrimonas haliotis]GLS82575.1 hypothetical protein GCM10007894_05520 [Paraferrimonas haliotis]
MDDVFFIAKKILSLLVTPVPLCVFLMVIGLYFQRNRSNLGKGLLVFAVLLLGSLSQPQVARWLSQPLEARYDINHQVNQSGCLIMVLGSAHTDNQSASFQQQLDDAASARLIEAVRQYKMGPGCQFVVSGYDGGYLLLPHAYVMAKAAEELGIRSSDIVALEKPKDTIEEAKALLQRVGKRKIRLVTSATHMPRAVTVFESFGFEVEPAPADFRARDGAWWRLSADNLLTSQRAIHEYVGLAWLKLKPSLLTEPSS